MGAFLFAAIGLIAVTILLLLRPWQQQRPIEADASVRELNAGIYRDQLAELDRDLAAGTIAPADHAQARDELQRRLLQDTATAPTSRAQPRTAARHTTLVLALAVPLAAAGLYAQLGAPVALLPQTQQAVADAHQGAAADIEQMVAALAARLEQNPGDTKGWAMLARSYHAMGRTAEAQAAFLRVGDELNKDPALLSAYADVLATQANGNIEGEPLRLVKTALQLDPDYPMALSLAATAAYKRNDFPEAARHWQRLLKQLPPESDDAKWLMKTLAEIGAPVAAAAPAGLRAAPGATQPAAGPRAKSVTGSVSLAPELMAQVKPTDTVFVFARATDGSPTPLAVQRAQVSDLPLQFTLDDTMLMNPQLKLSEMAEVRIDARVSRSGTAAAEAGDLITAGTVAKVGGERVALNIDRVRK
ncbi:MAG TPA: c-type cytochrome biogenesis protein CcmI [Albitalea sp.]